jgi:2-dehydropantoate 2-reductase
VENELAIAQTLSPEKVIAATVTSSVSRRGPGNILLERMRGIGIAADNPQSRLIQDVFSTSGLNAHLYPSARTMKWSKMLTNLMANASSAILDMPPSQILKDPALYSIEVAQLREAIAVCRAYGIKIIDLPGTPVRLFAWAVERLPLHLSRLLLSRIGGKGRGNKMPSFHIDLHSGRGITEVDYLNGAVVRYGQRKNIPTPINRWLNDTLTNLSQGALPLDEYIHQPLKFIKDITSTNIGR